MTTSIQGIGHLALRVTDLAHSKAFYVEVLQFSVRVERPTVALLSAYGITLALVGNDPHTAKDDHFDPYRVGLDHLALAVSDVQALSGLLDMLNKAGVRNNGIEVDEFTQATAITFYDPDGIAWEFYVAATPNA